MKELFRRHPLVLLLLAGVLLVAGIVWAVIALGFSLPPRHVVMTTGPEGGAYRTLGERYRSVLARHGVDLELRASAGDLENLKRLRDAESGVSIGFAGGGLATETESPGIVSLGTIGYYPLWIFCRGISEANRLRELRGKRVAIGPEGSGTHAIALDLFRANELENALRLETMGFAASGEALLAGELDCACMLTTPDAPTVKTLLADKRVDLVHFERADAYVALYPFLRKIVIPEGVGNLSANLPPRDVTLIASTTSLLVRKDLHPGIQFLLLQAADEIHSPGGILNRPEQFPAPEPVDFPISAEARSFYKSGGNFLQRHLPFWVWAFTSHLLLLLVPLVGILYPLSRAIPAILDLIVETRLNRIYKDLRALDGRIDSGESRAKLSAELDELEERVQQLSIPTRSSRLLYTLRQHLSLVEQRLGR
jgi:TRAP-type uncharacterized transport system substrate-binding protein